MEYVDGETLSAAKADRPHGCFDPDDIRAWIEQICDALAYAHHVAKIVHRDLKPANIMLTKSGTIKVTDFGIARSISDSISRVSMRHATSGTMVYMSPQQSSGARSSPSDDIYALGATIYDLLTGKPPFYSGNIQHQLESITPAADDGTPRGIGAYGRADSRSLGEGGRRLPRQGNLEAARVDSRTGRPAPTGQRDRAGRGHGGKAFCPAATADRGNEAPPLPANRFACRSRRFHERRGSGSRLVRASS